MRTIPVLFIFELGSRTMIGYVDPEQLIDPDSGKSLCIEEMEYVHVTYPSAVTNQYVPAQTAIQRPNQSVDVTIQTMVFPYYLDRMTIFISNLVGVAEVPTDSILYQEMKRIADHWEKSDNGKKPRTV